MVATVTEIEEAEDTEEHEYIEEEEHEPMIIDLKPAIFRWQYLHGRELTLAELAEHAQVSQSTMHRLKEGKTRKPDILVLDRLALFLECEVGHFFRREGEVKQIPLNPKGVS